MAPPTTAQTGAWQQAAQPKAIEPRLYNLIADNESLLTNILKTSRLELEQVARTYSDPVQFEQILRALINRGFVVTDQYSDLLSQFKQNINTAFEIGLNKGQSTPSAVMSIIQTTLTDSVMNYVTKMDTDLKQQLGKILADGYANKVMPNEIVKQMTNKVSISESRAGKIVRTETMRASQTASWAQNKVEGAKYFIVDHRAAACKRCISLFRNRIFGIDETKYIPPIHPNCACVAIFFNNKADAQKYLARVRKRNDLESDLLKKQGYTLPKDGTGPNATGKEQAKIIKQVDKGTQKTSKTKTPTQSASNWNVKTKENDVLEINGFKLDKKYDQYEFTKNNSKLNIAVQKGANVDKDALLKSYEKLPSKLKPPTIIIQNLPKNVPGRYSPQTKGAVLLSPGVKGDKLDYVLSHESYHCFEDVKRALPSVDPKRTESSTNKYAQNIISRWENAMKADALDGNPYKATKTNSWVSKYSYTNRLRVKDNFQYGKLSEDRAESASMYCADKNAFKRDYPHRYELFEKYIG